MKKHLTISCYWVLILLFSACGSSADLKSDAGAAEIQKMVEQDQFQFLATRAYPLDQSVTHIMQAMDVAGGAFQMLNLHDHYNLTMEGRRIQGDLPFFGRRYRASFSSDDKEFKIDFKNALVEKTEKNRKTTYLIHPNPEAHTVIEKLYLEVFTNGKAHLSISANDRQSISYAGYITHLPDTR